MSKSCSYVYAFGIPTALWAVMRYWVKVDSRSLVDFISLYGYGLVVWIPVAVSFAFGDLVESLSAASVFDHPSYRHLAAGLYRFGVCSIRLFLAQKVSQLPSF